MGGGWAGVGKDRYLDATLSSPRHQYWLGGGGRRHGERCVPFTCAHLASQHHLLQEPPSGKLAPVAQGSTGGEALVPMIDRLLQQLGHVVRRVHPVPWGHYHHFVPGTGDHLLVLMIGIQQDNHLFAKKYAVQRLNNEGFFFSFLNLVDFTPT